MATGIESRRSSRRIRLLISSACLLAVAGWFGAVQYRAHSDFRRGLSALDNDHPEAARLFFDQCLATWPTDAETHFRSAQAARRCGDFPEAERHLAEAQKLGWNPSDIELEHAMLSIQTGSIADAEAVLASALQQGHRETPQIFAVLVPALMQEFRWFDALSLVTRWTELKPDSAQAWTCQGDIYERLQKKNEAVNAFRQAINLNPVDERVRMSLARMLVQTRQPDEAVTHLELLAKSSPDDSRVTMLLGVCRDLQGDREQAISLLERAMAQNPWDAKAYHHRGRMELNLGKATTALPFLRRAAELDPSDPEILYSLVLCLQAAGLTDEARIAEERWKRCEADLKRVAEVARLVAVSPHNPDLRREMGELFLRNGRDQDGLRWLESALREQPDHAATHRLLADYYEHRGLTDQATYHRKFCQLAN